MYYPTPLIHVWYQTTGIKTGIKPLQYNNNNWGDFFTNLGKKDRFFIFLWGTVSTKVMIYLIQRKPNKSNQPH